jgi:hypothetical protein
MNNKMLFNIAMHAVAAVRTVFLMAISLTLLGLPAAFAAQSEPLADMDMQIERYAKAVMMVERGLPDGYIQLLESHDRIADAIDALQNGGRFGDCDVPPATGELQMSINKLAFKWAYFHKVTSVLLKTRVTMDQYRASIKVINDTAPELSEASANLVLLKRDNKRTLPDIFAAARLELLIARIVKNGNQILTDELPDKEVLFIFWKDIETFHNIINALINGSKKFNVPASKGKELELLNQISKLFEADLDGSKKMYIDLANFIANKQAVRVIGPLAETFSEDLMKISTVMNGKCICH